jgi:ATP-dependent protease HslVU (ClpYQ) peptidase subunit
MTCIAGVVHNGAVFIGADSAGVSGMDMTVRKDRKVFRVGEMLIGCTTSFRMAQLLQFVFEPPKQEDGEDEMAYMVRRFIPAIRQLFKDGGFARKDSDVESGGTFLVGYRGRLFCIFNDYQVSESMDGYDACGCGESYAKGVLFATAGIDPRERLKIALHAAEAHSAGVRAPFYIESTKEPK